MNNIIYIQSKTDWFVMNMVRNYLRELKSLPQTAETIEAIQRNEMALRSFHNDIKERSNLLAA